MSLVIILYLIVLTVFTFGFLYRGVSLFKRGIDESAKKRIRLILKAQETDVVDFEKFRSYDSRFLIITGLLYLSLIVMTILFVPNITTSLTTREIHLVRTCIIAVLVLYFFREMWLATVRENFVTRMTKSVIARYEAKTAIIFLVLSGTFIYSIYTQITFPW